jgi:hypothetical protein
MIDDAMLMAYVDGELDEADRLEVERQCAADPKLAARLARHVALRGRVAAAWSGALAEPVPERLAALVAKAPSPQPAQVVDLAAVRRARRAPAAPRPSWSPGGVLAAACLAAGLVIGFRGADILRPAAPVVSHGGALLAQGTLARALDGQLVAAQAPTQPIRIGFTVRAQDGRYCRTFLDHPARLAGLACRGPAAWTVQMAQAVGADVHGGGAYRTAADDLPASVLSAAQAITDSPALDAPAESAARARGWR